MCVFTIFCFCCFSLRFSSFCFYVQFLAVFACVFPLCWCCFMYGLAAVCCLFAKSRVYFGGCVQCFVVLCHISQFWGAGWMFFFVVVCCVCFTCMYSYCFTSALYLFFVRSL